MKKLFLSLTIVSLIITPACKRHPKHPNIAQGIALATGSALTVSSIPMSIVAAELAIAAHANIFTAIIFLPMSVGLCAAAGACLAIGLPLIIVGAATLKKAKPELPKLPEVPNESNHEETSTISYNVITCHNPRM